MKTFKKILLVLFLCLILIYVCNLTAIPNNIVLLEGESLNIPTLFGIEIYETENTSTIPVVENQNTSNNNGNSKQDTNTGKHNYNVSLANITLKNLTVNVIPRTSVVVCGNTIGAKLYTNGVLVVGMSEINGEKPYENSGIEEGDMIVEIDDETITCTADLIKKVNNCNREWRRNNICKRGRKVRNNIKSG